MEWLCLMETNADSNSTTSIQPNVLIFCSEVKQKYMRPNYTTAEPIMSHPIRFLDGGLVQRRTLAWVSNQPRRVYCYSIYCLFFFQRSLRFDSFIIDLNATITKTTTPAVTELEIYWPVQMVMKLYLLSAKSIILFAQLFHFTSAHIVSSVDFQYVQFITN